VEGLDILIYHDNIRISILISSYDILVRGEERFREEGETAQKK